MSRGLWRDRTGSPVSRTFLKDSGFDKMEVLTMFAGLILGLGEVPKSLLGVSSTGSCGFLCGSRS